MFPQVSISDLKARLYYVIVRNVENKIHAELPLLLRVTHYDVIQDLNPLKTLRYKKHLLENLEWMFFSLLLVASKSWPLR